MILLHYTNNGGSNYGDATVCTSRGNHIIKHIQDFQNISNGKDLLEALDDHYKSAVALRDELNSYINSMKSGDITLKGAEESSDCTLQLESDYFKDIMKKFKVKTLDMDDILSFVEEIDNAGQLQFLAGFIKGVIDRKNNEEDAK